MIYLNAGNLWTTEYLDKVIELNSTHKRVLVGALFGSVAGLTPTARSQDRLPKIDLDDVPAYCKKADNAGINIRYTLNQSCIGSMQDFYADWKDYLLPSLTFLHNKCGVHEWTVTSPLLVERLRECFPRDFIEVSTIAEVSTVVDAKRWIAIGADGANLSTSINREFGTVSDLENMFHVTLLANEACLYKCPWRRECYNLSSHNSSRSKGFFDHYPFSRCNKLRMKYPAEWLKARMILPQWMDSYERHTGVNWFKVSFRTHPITTALPILEAYMDEQHSGNLVDLWPTIAHLGNTDDPRDVTYISCKKLDELDFLRPWLDGQSCNNVECGTDCTYCMRVYEVVKGR